MELFIGRSRSWDAHTYPRVGQWPLEDKREKALLAGYAHLLIAAYKTYELWIEAWRQRRVEDVYFSVKLDAADLPAKVYVVLGANPEKITWSGEWAPYRLRIELVWCPERRVMPAFISREEAQNFAEKCLAEKPESRFTIAELAVIG